MKTKIYFAVCSLALIAIALTPTFAVQPTVGVSFAQVSFTDPQSPQAYSRYGQAFIDATALYGSGYINVERYDNGKAAGWVVRNFPVTSGSHSPGFTGMFDLGAEAQQASFSAYVDFSPDPLADDRSLIGQVPLTYPLAQAQHFAAAPAADPGRFEDVVCYQNDAKFWGAQPAVAQVMTWIDSSALSFKDGSGWLIKGKDPKTVLLITAAHNFKDSEKGKVNVTFDFQTPQCGKGEPVGWGVEVDEVLERNTKLDYLIVSLKPREGKKFPSPLQALDKKVNVKDVVMIPQHPGGDYKKAGYYYDVDKKERCYVTKFGNLNANQVDSKCPAKKGSSGSPVLDTDGNPIALLVAYRLANLDAVGYLMSAICADDAGKDGKKLLDCKKP